MKSIYTLMKRYSRRAISDALPPVYSESTVRQMLAILPVVRLRLGRFERTWTPSGEVYGPGIFEIHRSGGWMLGEVPDEKE